MSVCLFVHRFLGHFKRTWMPFGTKSIFAPVNFLKQFLRKLKKPGIGEHKVQKSDLNFKAY